MNAESFLVELSLEGDVVVATLTEVCEEQVDIELAEFELRHPITEVINRRNAGRPNWVQLFFDSTSQFLLQYDKVPIAVRAVLLKTKGYNKDRYYGLTQREIISFLKKLTKNNGKINYKIRRI